MWRLHGIVETISFRSQRNRWSFCKQMPFGKLDLKEKWNFVCENRTQFWWQGILCVLYNQVSLVTGTVLLLSHHHLICFSCSYLLLYTSCYDFCFLFIVVWMCCLHFYFRINKRIYCFCQLLFSMRCAPIQTQNTSNHFLNHWIKMVF